jgi:hypothetical protein
MASVSTTDLVIPRKAEPPPFSLIEYKGLFGRLADELKRTGSEFAGDPKAFVAELLKGETRDARRRRLLYSGLLAAAVLHAAFLAIVVIAGWHRFMTPVESKKEEVMVLTPEWLGPRAELVEPPKPRGEKDGGGGGGGNHDLKPASSGRLPQFAPIPQIVSPDTPESKAPTLAIPETLVGTATDPPPPVPIGDPNSTSTAPSTGPGSGGGRGPGDGKGTGPGAGSGSGPGSSRGVGHGINEGDPGGASGPIEIAYNAPRPEGFIPFRWLYRPTPVTTPEAQADKVIGVVYMKATFNANGTISDIEVIMPVEHMTESAVQSLQKSRFKPATVNGKPITLRRVPISVAVHY